MMTRDERIEAIKQHLARKHRIWPADRHWIQTEFLLCMYEERPAGTSKRPPWQHGRHKTRGGRDQDRWRKIEARMRLREWMRPHLFVNGVEVRYDTLTLNDRLACDNFVKGGE